MFPGGEIDSKLDLAARSRMASLRASMFGASAEPARVGRFVVLETLGAGGMGVVHAAYDPRLDRKIALKLVRPEVAAAGTNGEARLLREAQAMARLSHPNVVQIHEVGAWEGRVFIAMELVAGKSLATWLEEKPRAWREVVHMFAEAGRGLAAAHAAGMVHRDFKPENVLVGDDGRVRVTDFGLARGGDGVSEAGETWREPGDPLAAIVAGMSVGTAAFAGTPRFMSPEQFLGEPATAASDQFSFCVALYVALHGVHPFVGEDRATLAKAVIAGERKEPARVRVPRKIHKAVVRGLSRAPEKRFPGMGALLREIEPRASWQRLAPMALFAVTGAGTVGVLYEGDPCEDASGLLGGVWDEAVEGRTRQALVTPGDEDAMRSWSSMSRDLDDYVGAAAGIYTGTCRGYRQGSVSSELHDLRIDCLVRRLEVVRGLLETAVASHAGTSDVMGAVSRLEPVAACIDMRRLRGEKEPVPPGQAVALKQLERELERAYALELIGDAEASRRHIHAVLTEARALGYAPTIAEVLYRRGRLEVHERNFDTAAAALSEAREIATVAKFDALVGDLWPWLIQARALGGARTDAAEEWLSQAEAWQRREGGGLLAQADLERVRGIVKDLRGDFVGAEEASGRALALRLGELGSEHVDVAIERMNHANILGMLGAVDEAIAEQRVALESLLRKLGERHGLVAEAHYNLGAALLRKTGEEAISAGEEHIRRANTIIEARRGPDAIELADGHVTLAQVAQLRGDQVTAERGVSRALQVYDRYSGHPDRAYALRLHGQILYTQGRLEEALYAQNEAREVAAAAWGESSDLVGLADGDIGDVLRGQGDLRGAARRYESAVANLGRALGEDSRQLVGALVGLGQTRMALGERCEAAVPLERALVTMKRAGEDAAEIAAVDGIWSDALAGCER